LIYGLLFSYFCIASKSEEEKYSFFTSSMDLSGKSFKSLQVYSSASTYRRFYCILLNKQVPFAAIAAAKKVSEWALRRLKMEDTR